MGVNGIASSSGKRVTLSIFIFTNPTVAAVDLTLSRIGHKWSTSNYNGTVLSIRDIIKSIASAIGIEKRTPEIRSWYEGIVKQKLGWLLAIPKTVY